MRRPNYGKGTGTDRFSKLQNLSGVPVPESTGTVASLARWDFRNSHIKVPPLNLCRHTDGRADESTAYLSNTKELLCFETNASDGRICALRDARVTVVMEG